MSKVLVVDDHLDTCALLVRLLRRTGIDAACVDSGQGALEMLKAERPALMILDVMMPGLGGMDVLKLVRSDPDLQALPVVMYSAMADAESREEALRLGAQDYVVKGRIDYDALKALVLKYIGEEPTH